MILILKDTATHEQINKLTQIYLAYTKVVVDIKRNVLAAGGEFHIDCEQVLLADGSVQDNLWGGGYNFENKEVDFLGLTNYKPNIDHLSYEITTKDIRQQVESMIRKVFDNEQE